jgi:hypothetical protein
LATLIPSRSICRPRMTAGERRFADRLEDKLEDDYLVWYDVPVGPRQRRPDFTVLHPGRGLLVLEVKDWKPDALHAIDRSRVQLLTDRGLVSVANPMLQARTYALELADLLQRDPALRAGPGHRHEGKLVMPWGYGIVLTHITRAQFDAGELEHFVPAHKVICRDEMTEGEDIEAFQTRLWDMFDHRFGDALTLPQINRIRWHLFPELRVRPPLQPDLLAEPSTGPLPKVLEVPDVIRVMDLQQEQLARSLGDGHRVIHGVAGSGKTMILGYRCLHLARESAKPILVLCFNRTLAARLDQVIRMHALQAQVEILSFHRWCAQMLRTYNIPKPANDGDADAFFAAQVQAVIKATESGYIPRGQYGAVLIDEGHDFEPDWLRLIVQMVDPASNSLLLLYDDAQAIYSKRERRKFSFASVGVQAKGRTTILKLNYRNTYEILSLARAFAEDLFDGGSGDEDMPAIIAPESVGRHGPPPQLIRCGTRAEEADTLATLIDDARNDGCPLDQIAVIWRHQRDAYGIERQLQRRGLPVAWARTAEEKDRLFAGAPSIKFVSMHSSKGLEFERVFIPALDTLPGANEDEAAEARLLYVAMTRATDRLVLAGAGDSRFESRISQATAVT